MYKTWVKTKVFGVYAMIMDVLWNMSPHRKMPDKRGNTGIFFYSYPTRTCVFLVQPAPFRPFYIESSWCEHIPLIKVKGTRHSIVGKQLSRLCDTYRYSHYTKIILLKKNNILNRGFFLIYPFCHSLINLFQFEINAEGKRLIIKKILLPKL